MGKLPDGSVDVDGLLFPPLFDVQARALVLDLLRGEASERLGCYSAAGSVAGCDRVRNSAVDAPAQHIEAANDSIGRTSTSGACIDDSRYFDSKTPAQITALEDANPTQAGARTNARPVGTEPGPLEGVTHDSQSLLLNSTAADAESAAHSISTGSTSGTGNASGAALPLAGKMTGPICNIVGHVNDVSVPAASLAAPRIPVSVHQARRAARATSLAAAQPDLAEGYIATAAARRLGRRPVTPVQSATLSAPGRGAARTAESTVPSTLPVVDHAQILSHPFLASVATVARASYKTDAGSFTLSESDLKQAAADVSRTWAEISEATTVLEAASAVQAANTSGNDPLRTRALNHIALLVSVLRPVRLEHMRDNQTIGTREPLDAQTARDVSAWQLAANAMRSLDGVCQAALLHLLALRRRLHAPHIGALFCSEPSLARCARWTGIVAQPASRSAAAPTLLRCGTVSPREAVGWNLSQSGYVFPVEQPQRQTWVPASLPGTSATAFPPEPGDSVNDMGWQLVSSQDYHAPHYFVVIGDLGVLLERSTTVDHSLHALVAAINALRPAPRAIILMGRLLLGSNSVAERKSLLHKFSASIVHEATPIIVATHERIWAALSLPESVGGEETCESHAATQLAERVDGAIGAWLSGVRILICDTATATLAMRTSSDNAASDAASCAHRQKIPPLPTTAAESDAFWLLDALEQARAGAHHTVLLLRDAARYDADVSAALSGTRLNDSIALAHLLQDSNVRCVLQPAAAEAADAKAATSYQAVPLPTPSGASSASTEGDTALPLRISLQCPVIASSATASSTEPANDVHLTLLKVTQYQVTPAEAVVRVVWKTSAINDTYATEPTDVFSAAELQEERASSSGSR